MIIIIGIERVSASSNIYARKFCGLRRIGYLIFCFLSSMLSYRFFYLRYISSIELSSLSENIRMNYCYESQPTIEKKIHSTLRKLRLPNCCFVLSNLNVFSVFILTQNLWLKFELRKQIFRAEMQKTRSDLTKINGSSVNLNHSVSVQAAQSWQRNTLNGLSLICLRVSRCKEQCFQDHFARICARLCTNGLGTHQITRKIIIIFS